MLRCAWASSAPRRVLVERDGVERVAPEALRATPRDASRTRRQIFTIERVIDYPLDTRSCARVLL
jgi:hypothetical protein